MLLVDQTFRPCRCLNIRPLQTCRAGGGDPADSRVFVPQTLDDGIELPSATLGVVPSGEKESVPNEKGFRSPESVNR